VVIVLINITKQEEMSEEIRELVIVSQMAFEKEPEEYLETLIYKSDLMHVFLN
jgi:hypothetical protein